MDVKRYPGFAVRLSVYTFGHFFFEFAANYFIISLIAPQITSYPQMITVLLLYNICDYGLQVLIGLLDDVVHRNHFFAAFGAALFIIGYFCSPIPLLMAVVVGTGAAFIHVPLGRQVLLDRPDSYAALAPFVASGSFGVFLGRKIGLIHVEMAGVILVLALGMMFLLVTLGAGERTGNGDIESSRRNQQLVLTRPVMTSIWILLMAVTIQSFTFAVSVFSWDNGFLAWAAAVAILFAKGIGGWFADYFGYLRTVMVSGVIALISAGFAPSYSVLGIVFLFAFNVPSATIIFRLARRLSPAVGTGFGLYKFFHLVGFLPTLFWGTGKPVSPLTLIMLTVLVGALMLAEERIKE